MSGYPQSGRTHKGNGELSEDACPASSSNQETEKRELFAREPGTGRKQ